MLAATVRPTRLSSASAGPEIAEVTEAKSRRDQAEAAVAKRQRVHAGRDRMQRRPGQSEQAGSQICRYYPARSQVQCRPPGKAGAGSGIQHLLAAHPWRGLRQQRSGQRVVDQLRACCPAPLAGLVRSSNLPGQGSSGCAASARLSHHASSSS